MPLIGAADASLRGLRSPEGDEQKAFWSSPLSDLQSSGWRMMLQYMGAQSSSLPLPKPSPKEPTAISEGDKWVKASGKTRIKVDVFIYIS